MVGSIDPRCETVRGTHWPKKVAWLFGARVAETILASGPKSPHQQAGNHLGQRSKVTASTGRTYGRKRSDQTVEKTLVARGPSTYGSLRSQGRPYDRCENYRINRLRSAFLARSPTCFCT